MSGGSYNYICFCDATDLASKQGQIQPMADRLRQLGYDDLAKETESILKAYDGIDKKLLSISNVRHAVEWLDSGDWSEQSARAEIEYERHKR